MSILYQCVCYLLQSLVVEFEGPELQTGGQGADGGQAAQELLCRAQGDVRIGQLSLLDLLLLLLCWGHGQDFLLRKEGDQLSLVQSVRVSLTTSMIVYLNLVKHTFT